MSRPVISSSDVDRLVHALQRFDDARDQLAQAQQIVVTELGIWRSLLERAGVLSPPPPFEVKIHTPPPRRKLEVRMSPVREAIFCAHANEVPQNCKCPDDCYCKSHTCKAG
jgi:hypothetical protein